MVRRVSSPAADGPARVPHLAESAARRLHPAAPVAAVLDSHVLTQIAEGLAQVVDDRDPVPAGGLRRRRLLATEGYDAWLLSWGPRARLDEHDHDGSVGVVHVVRGHLVEEGAHLAGSGARTVGPGRTSAVSATDRHALAAGGDGALSIHVASPPAGGPATPATDVSPN